MTRVSIDLRDVSGYSPAQGDVVQFEAPYVRGSAKFPGGVVSTAPVNVPLKNGQGTVDLEPGEVRVTIKARSFRGQRQFDGVVPAEGTSGVTLLRIVENEFDYPPAVISETTSLVLRAEASARSAGDFAKDALSSKNSAEESASAVKSSESIVTTFKDAAAASASAAKTSETNAKASESKAKASESNAKASETNAKASESNAKASETNAKASESNAKASETNAKASEVTAASSASSAKAEADRAAGIASSTSWSGDRLTVNGQTSPSLTGPQGDPGPKGEPGVALVENPLTSRVDILKLVAANRTDLTASHPYADPSEEQVSEVLNAVRLLMRGTTATAPNGMEIIEGYSEEANRNVRVLRSIPGNGLYWGMWVFPINFTFSGIVEAPHPVFDAGSDDIACKVWAKAPKGTVLAVAGSHRTNPDGTDPRDVAHNTKSMWHRVTTAIAQPGLPEFQLHGFGDDSMPGVGAVVSSGSSPLSAGVIRTEAFIAAAGITTARQWDGSATKLIGMSNIQGDAAAVRGNPFLHIELSKSVRDSHDAFVDAVVSAGFLAGENGALLTNEFPKAVGSVNGRGSSMTAARADHTHRLVQNDPADGEVVVRQSGGWRSVPAQSIGAVPQNVVDAATQVEAATYSATANTLMKRTSTGAVSVADPTASVHAANKKYVDGVAATKADLANGQVPTSQLPAVALTKPFVVSDRSAMLKLAAEEGDVAVITSGVDKGTYMLGTGAASVFASWVRLASPDGAVSSVNGQTGVVNLSAADVGAASSDVYHRIQTAEAILDSATAEPLRNSYVRRDMNGRAKFADPSSAGDAANKRYVDSRTPKIQVVSSMPSSPDANTLYVVI